MRVLVTGGSGFIGAAVVSELEEHGHDVQSFDRAHGQDVRDKASVERQAWGRDVVIHLAGVLGTAELLDTVRTAVDVNVLGTAAVLDACRDAECRYVGITMPDCWPSLYQATKLCATRIADAYQNAYSLPVTHVRTFNVYGPGQAHGAGHPQKILPTFAVAAHRGDPLPIWGDGQNTVDLVHVEDVARTFREVLEKDVHGTVDCGSAVESSVNEVAAAVCAAAGVPFTPKYLPMRAGELPGTYLSASPAAMRDVSWGEDWHQDQRFQEAVDWYRTFA